MRAHLEAQGLTIVQVPGNRAFVEAHGAASKMERAFATRLGRFQVGTELRRAPLDAPTLPEALSARVSSV
ncbi:MAG TPA: protease pro-enzyme activation domain-containing protein, partial [Polyangiaceae bacterium]